MSTVLTGASAARASTWILAMGGALMAFATIFGALGAHALPGQLGARELNIYDTAVRFQSSRPWASGAWGRRARRLHPRTADCGAAADRRHRGLLWQPLLLAFHIILRLSPDRGSGNTLGRHSADRRVGDVCRHILAFAARGVSARRQPSDCPSRRSFRN